MTEQNLSIPIEEPQPIQRFADRPSPLLDVVRAHRTGDADWATTKAALLAFPYKAVEPTPSIGDEGYGQWYVHEDGSKDPEPGTFGELTMAAHLDMLPWEKYMEVLREVTAKADERTQSATAPKDDA